MKSVTALLLLSLFNSFEVYEAASTKKLPTVLRSQTLQNGTLATVKTSPLPPPPNVSDAKSVKTSPPLPPPPDVSDANSVTQQSIKSVAKENKSNKTKTEILPQKTNTATNQKPELPAETVSLQRKLTSHVSSNAALNNSSALSYYNYPFHQYALPECATQQVCNAVYTRLDRINALCACPQKFGDPCSISFGSDDAHTIELVTDNRGKALTLIKTCEPIGSVRECRGSKDWSLLALQNVRTGKSHYLVVCRCVQHGILEGPIAHENPPYAKIPGIRVYGMICIRDVWGRGQTQRGSRSPRDARAKKLVRRRNLPEMPWHLMQEFVRDINWN